jgi:hypothetical protein
MVGYPKNRFATASPIPPRLGHRMTGLVDTFVKLCVGVSLLGAAGSIGYYYTVYLPSRDAQFDRDRRLEAARVEYSRQAEQARLAAEKRDAEKEQAAAREAVQARYQNCVRQAENLYSFSWANQCKSTADKAARELKDCLSQVTLSKSSCETIYGGRDSSPNCALPRPVGSDLSDTLDKSRRRCLDESRAGLQ